MFFYAAAFAVARADGRVCDGEAALLRDLGAHLGLDPEERRRAEATAVGVPAVASYPGGAVPGGLIDLLALRDALIEPAAAP